MVTVGGFLFCLLAFAKRVELVGCLLGSFPLCLHNRNYEEKVRQMFVECGWLVAVVEFVGLLRCFVCLLFALKPVC